MNGSYHLEVPAKVPVPTLLPHTDVAMRMAILTRGAIVVRQFAARWILAHKQPVTSQVYRGD